VSDLHSGTGQGGIVWSAAGMSSKDGKLRATSPPNAAYFGRTDQPCPGGAGFCPSFDNSKVVGATMLSSEFTVPAAAKVTLTFQLLLDVAPLYDQLTVVVQNSFGLKKTVWQKQTTLPGGSTNGAFQLQSADLSEFVGQKIRLEITFNSQTAANNDGEGVFVDDLLVGTTCATGSGVGKGLIAGTWFGVWAASDQAAWAVGQNGAIARWNGKSWALLSGGPPAKELLGIGGAPGGPGFAVGAQTSVSEVAGGLAPVSVPPLGKDLFAVAVTPAKDAAPMHAVAVGNQGTILELQDNVWSVAGAGVAPFVNLRGVTALGGGAYAAVGGNVVLEKQGGAWSNVETVFGTLAAVSAADGTAFAVGSNGLIVRRTAEGWLAEELAASANLTGVATVSANDVWAVGDFGTLLHFDGTAWQEPKSPTTVNLRGVWAAGPQSVFAVGLLGTLLRWDGTQWFKDKSPAAVDWLGVWGKSAKEVYAIGPGGLLAQWNGEEWSVLNKPVTHSLRAVWGSSAQDVWAVGEKGAIYHSTGGGWTQVPIEPHQPDPEAKPYKVETTLLTVWGSGPSDVWAAGVPNFDGKGTLVHWDGAKWTYQDAMQAEGRTFRAIWGWGKDKVLLAGTQGMVWFWDGKKYTELHPPTIATLFGIAQFGKSALLVGDIGTVLRYTPLAQ